MFASWVGTHEGKSTKGNHVDMEAAQTLGVVSCVEKVGASLAALDCVLTGQFVDGDDEVRAKAVALERHAEQLHALVDETSKQRVLMLPAEQLMESGIVVYNAARATYKKFLSRGKQDSSCDIAAVCYPVLLVRFLAARVMGLALACSKGIESGSTTTAGDQSVFVDDCLDVLRSYGRVGSLLLHTASTATSKCHEYLTMAKEALEHANNIWSRLGLSCLTRFRTGVELDEILQDLWDFCVDRLRAGHLLQPYTSDGSSVVSFIEPLHELQMLLPYMCGNTVELLELLQCLVEELSNHGRYDDLAVLSEEALRLCDAAEAAQDAKEDWATATYKQYFLTALLRSLENLGDVERAEACFSLLGQSKPPTALLTMLKLYLHQHMPDRANIAMNHLLQLDDVVASIAGARMFAEFNDFSAESTNVYRQLERHYGDHVLEIRLDLACALIASEKPDHRMQATSELARLLEIVKVMPSDARARMRHQSKDIQLIIYDAAKSTLNEGTVEECSAWVELALELAATSIEMAALKRIMAAAYLKSRRFKESWSWAESAMALDSSKASLLSMFEASLGLNEERKASLELYRQLKERDDFQPQDLVVFGYSAHSRGLDDVCLMIMDDLCCILRTGQDPVDDLPFGILLQNTAQLALRAFSMAKSSAEEAATTSYAKKLVTYVDMFLLAAQKQDSTTIDHFATRAVFVWFYTTSFNVARSCNDGQLFVRAADCAKQAFRLFGGDCQISQREAECLLAALGTVMADFDKLDRASLTSVLELVTRIKLSANYEHRDFVTKSELASRLRLCDRDIGSLRKLCLEGMLISVANYIDVGELILQAASVDEAGEMRSAYRGLARDMFKQSLQLSLQNDDLNPTRICYLLRRLITLAEVRYEALEWFEQLVQLQASVSLNISELDAEWFVARAWNLGVQCHRRQLFDEAQKFMKMSLSLLASVGVALKELANDLHDQYQEFMTVRGHVMLPVD